MRATTGSTAIDATHVAAADPARPYRRARTTVATMFNARPPSDTGTSRRAAAAPMAISNPAANTTDTTVPSASQRIAAVAPGMSVPATRRPSGAAAPKANAASGTVIAADHRVARTASVRVRSR